MERTQDQGRDDQEGIYNFVFVVGLYNQDPCIPANFFIINLPSGRTEDVRA